MLSPDRSPLRTRCVVASLLVFCGTGHLSPVEAKSKVPDKNIFSSPDSDHDVVPTFVGNNGKPYNANRPLQNQGLAGARQLPSLTKEQRKQVDQIQTDLNLRLSSLREHIQSLEAQLDVMKGHPGDKVEVGKPGFPGETIPAAVDLKRQIADLKTAITDKQKEASDQAIKVLTEKQVQEYQAMRRGELVIRGAPTETTPGTAGGASSSTAKKHHGGFGALLKKIFH